VTTQVPVFVGFPGVTVGSVATTAQTSFAGGDISLRRVLLSNEDFRLELFAGYRQMHLGDELGSTFRASGGLGTVLQLTGDDSVRTRNNFYGGQVGGLGSFAFGRWSIQGLSSVALGMNASDLDFSHTRLATIGTTTVPLVEMTKGGQVNYFSVVSEGGLRLGYRITEHAKLTVGYTGIYWTNVRRAQEQYNLSSTLTGGTTHFYTNLLTLGAEVRY
jgi:outer membrane protease